MYSRPAATDYWVWCLVGFWTKSEIQHRYVESLYIFYTVQMCITNLYMNQPSENVAAVICVLDVYGGEELEFHTGCKGRHSSSVAPPYPANG